MNKTLSIPIIIAVIVLGYLFLSRPSLNFSTNQSTKEESHPVNQALGAQFDYLSKNGNSSCAASFKNSVASMPDDARLQGSCCSPMSMHRYSEQIEGLKKFKSEPSQNIAKIPDDPYNIEAGLVKELMSYYDMELTLEEQAAYDYAMQNSSEKGPCCCKCWRWNTYGGLAKHLIRNYKFTGEQVTELWNLSDGCGGDEEHHHS